MSHFLPPDLSLFSLLVSSEVVRAERKIKVYPLSLDHFSDEIIQPSSAVILEKMDDHNSEGEAPGKEPLTRQVTEQSNDKSEKSEISSILYKDSGFYKLYYTSSSSSDQTFKFYNFLNFVKSLTCNIMYNLQNIKYFVILSPMFYRQE